MSRAHVAGGRTYPWSKLDPERRNALLLIGGISVIVVFALALVAYGYYNERVAPDHATVLQVGKRQFNYDYLQRRAMGELRTSGLSQQQLPSAIVQVLFEAEREEALRQAAQSVGVTVSEDEMDARLRSRLGASADTSKDILGTRLRSELIRNKLSLSEYLEIAKAQVIEQKLRAQYGEAVPAEAPHVNVHLIKTASKDKAQTAKDRLTKGDSFGVVAVDLSIADSAKTTAGDLAWVPLGGLQPQVEDVAFKLDVGATSDIIEADDGGFYIVEVDGKETRPVDDNGKDTIIQQHLDTLLDGTRKTAGSQVRLTQQQLSKLTLLLGGPSA